MREHHLDRSTTLAHKECANYLAHPVLGAYFKLREIEIHLKSIIHKATLRESFDDYINNAENFLQRVSCDGNLLLLDHAVFGSKRAKHAIEAPRIIGSIPNDLKSYCKLLDLILPITFESLKQAYRRAAKINHPDAGGSHDRMVQINDAYKIMHNMVCDHLGNLSSLSLDDQELCQMKDSLTGMGAIFPCSLERPTSARQYAATVHEALFHIYADSWDVSKAWEHWYIVIEEYKRLRLGRACHSLVVVHGASFLSQLMHYGRLSEADQIRDLMGPVNGRALSHIGAQNRDYSRSNRLVPLTHRKQAENLRAAGLISKTRCTAARTRFDAQEACEEQKDRILKTFLATGGFIPELSADQESSVVRGRKPKSTLVPETGYFNSNLTALTIDQKSEYFLTFSAKSSLRLVRKYAAVRLESLLRSAALSVANSSVNCDGNASSDLNRYRLPILPLGLAIRECDLLKAIQRPRSRLGLICERVRRLLEQLARMTDPPRQQGISDVLALMEGKRPLSLEASTPLGLCLLFYLDNIERQFESGLGQAAMPCC